MSFSTRFSNLGDPRRIWTISAINGEYHRLAALHRSIYDGFVPGDRLVYTGNYFCGATGNASATFDEILLFRRSLMARDAIKPEDIVYLRGMQEEIWSKILSLPYAPDRETVVQWISQAHPEIQSLLKIYGADFSLASRIAREGVLSTTKWVTALKQAIRETKGHEAFFNTLRRAAFTDHSKSNDNNLLFVHSGINPDVPLTSQGDCFWTAAKNFNYAMTPYAPFGKVIRGHDPEHRGMFVGHHRISLNAGERHRGKLVCARMTAYGLMQDVIAA